MIVGLGVDLVPIERAAALRDRHGERFLVRCFASTEVVRPADPAHLAGLLAAKEAAFKALGTGWAQGVGWRDVVVAHSTGGAPTITLLGAAAVRAETIGAVHSYLSISHAGGMAVAVVVLEA